VSAIFQDGADRAARRGAGVVLFRPPEDQLSVKRWHTIDTHLGRRRLLWQPGIDVWRGEYHERWTAQFGGEYGWIYVGVADNQVNVRPRKS
jgi:hypothetical protein